MKVSSNRIGDIRSFYRAELSSIMNEQEAGYHIDSVISHFTNFPRMELPLLLDKRVGESMMLKIHFAVKELLQHRPLQYVLGETTFFDLPFKLNEDVLIPRPETEELVSLIIKDNSKIKEPLKILDIGSGSACIAVSLAKNLTAEVYALDVSVKAIEIAKRNAELNQVKVEFMHLDILEESNYKTIPYDLDLIVSNPPYVREQEKEMMQKNVLDFEPMQALFVEDNNALLFYKAISKMAARHLKRNGTLWFEINEYLADETKAEVLKYFNQVQVLNDYKNRPRFIKAGND